MQRKRKRFRLHCVARKQAQACHTGPPMQKVQKKLKKPWRFCVLRLPQSPELFQFQLSLGHSPKPEEAGAPPGSGATTDSTTPPCKQSKVVLAAACPYYRRLRKARLRRLLSRSSSSRQRSTTFIDTSEAPETDPACKGAMQAPELALVVTCC